MITLSIDGKKTEVEEGTTVFEAATSLGIHIPTLCYHPELKPNSACRLCTVEVTQNGRTVEDVPPRMRYLPQLVLHRNGGLTDPDKRTLIVEVSGIIRFTVSDIDNSHIVEG